MIHSYGRLTHLIPLVVPGLIVALFTHQSPLNAEARKQAAQWASIRGHDQATQTRLLETYGRLPLSFEANQGQLDPRVRFLSRGRGYSLFLEDGEATLRLSKTGAAQPRRSGKLDPMLRSASRPDPSQKVSTALRLKLVGANPAVKVTGLDELPGKANYFLGKDPGKWRTSVLNYARVRYENIYPGVDLVYYGNQRQLEYDFVVAPGADPRSIVIAIEGDGLQRVGVQADVRIDNDGNLVIQSDGAQVQFHKPLIYQQASGSTRGTSRSDVDGHYVLLADHRVGFEVGTYDPHLPLVIDPVLSYSTYLGGSAGDEAINMATDPAGNAYMVGQTNSSDFPTSSGAYSTTINATPDFFVTKLDPTGSTIVYSTYLGGSSLDMGLGVAVDASGNVYVTGYTASVDFPTTQGAVQPAIGPIPQDCSWYYSPCGDAFAAKINPTGSALIYSTYLGGSLLDSAFAIAADPAGNACVTGFTTSSDFPLHNAFQSSFGGYADSFVTKLRADGTALIYSTYLGGTDDDEGGGIAVDLSGNAYVAGGTRSSDFPVTYAIPPVNAGPWWGTITKINPEGSELVYSTLLSGAGPSDIATDIFGNAFVTGGAGPDFHATAGTFQEQFNSTSTNPGDAFVAKLDAAGSQLVYATYVGGSRNEWGAHIAVDSAGNAYVTGKTLSTDFPTERPIQATNSGGSSDAFITALNATGSALLFSTYLGGDGEDWGRGVDLDRKGNVYLAGRTTSTNFPTVNPVQEKRGGDDYTVSNAFRYSDAFVAKISASDVLPPPTGSVTDPDRDVQPSSLDLVSASLTSVPGGAAVTLSVRFAGPYDSQTTEASFNLDTDQNPFTGWPGVDPANKDSGLVGTDYRVQMGPACGNGKAQILKYNSSAPSGWDTLSDQPDVTIFPNGDGMDVTVPLIAIGDPTAVNFKVTSEISSCSPIYDALDYTPDPGLPPGIWTNLITPPPQPLDATEGEPAQLTYDFGPYNYLIDYIGQQDYEGRSLRVTSMDTTQVEYQQRVAGTPYEGTTCAVFNGTGGYCEVFRVTCEDSSGTTVACPYNPNPYTVTINWNTQTTITNPGFLKAPLGTNSWENILVFFSQKRLDPDPTGVGRTKGSFSDFVFIEGVSGTPTASVAITTPVNNATYALNQDVYAQYSCAGTLPEECVGTVNNGSRIDTDSSGTKSFGVGAVVSAGPTVTKSVTYYVAKYGIGILPSPSVKGGLPQPVVLELRDDKGNDVSSRAIALKAQGIVRDDPNRQSVLQPPGFAKSSKGFQFIPWPGSNGRYAYTIDTLGLKTGSYLLLFTVSADTGTIYSIPFQLK